MFKLLCVTISSQPSTIEYVDSQIQAISNSFPDLVIEHVHEDNEDYASFCRRSNRFPAFLLFEREVYRTEFIGQVETQQLLDWLTSLSLT